jgi:hypothetical protein
MKWYSYSEIVRFRYPQIHWSQQKLSPKLRSNITEPFALNKQTDFAFSIELKKCKRVILNKPTADFRAGAAQVIAEHRRET